MFHIVRDIEFDFIIIALTHVTCNIKILKAVGAGMSNMYLTFVDHRGIMDARYVHKYFLVFNA
jgi:hypothetical protein